MRIITVLFFISCLTTSCSISNSYTPKNAIELYSGWNPMTKLWGWIIVGPKIVYTSAHLLKNDAQGYLMIQSGAKVPLKLLLRDRSTDEAFLAISELSEKEIGAFFMDFREDINDRRQEVQVGSTIMAELVFSWKALMKTWTVLDTAWDILTLDSKWSVASLTGVILTDIDFKKGDSGSPIFNIDGELIDVVHIK